jgi:Ca2+-binding RTX toxin-like protein
MGFSLAARAALGLFLCVLAVEFDTRSAHAVTPNGPDLEFILEQIKRSEAHAAGGQLSGTGPNQISSPLLPYGLRTVDGTFNNLIPGQEKFGSADQIFPRLLAPVFRPADTFDPDGPGPAPAVPTTYAQDDGLVADSQPRVISNLVVDQTAANPAAVAAAGSEPPDADGNLFIPNRAPDVGLSAPFNSWFTLFGQFFDHGLDLTTKGGSGTVIVPLKPGDPLYQAGSPTNFMVLTRATNQKGPDGVLGTSDDVHEHTNTTTPFVDQNQTYTSHPSHQVFLREFEADALGKAVPTGRLLDRAAGGGLATWKDVKAQARTLLGIELDDQDILDVPLLKTDEYGRFIPHPTTGLAQIVVDDSPLTFESGTPATAEAAAQPVDATRAIRTGHAFLDDIAHHAVPFGDHDNRPDTPRRALGADTNTATGDDGNPATYDDELLDAHFITGDGRGNENIGLTAVHHVFHAEHNLRVGEIKSLIEEPGGPAPADWQLPNGAWSGDRLFQAARFITEMEYQHLVFEEFARKVQPQVNLFAGYDSDIDPTIVAEFAHTVYRFGHSMLTETVARKNADGTSNDIGLIEGFLNPLAFHDSGTPGAPLSSEQAAGSIVRGMTGQVGNEIDEFVTGALRNNLVGLPLDLATINMARGRETGVPGINAARRTFYAATSNSALQPYESWKDFGLGIKHPESLVNFIAAYGTHPTITAATTLADKRAAAKLIVEGGPGAPADREAFLDSRPSSEDWKNGADGVTTTGVDEIDFWIGGLAEKQMPFGGLLGSTFNFVFETQMEKLQDGDRLYYLSRTAGLNFLTQLEENSFAELVMRTTDTTHLPFDIFSRPDYTFELKNLDGPDGTVLNDPATPYDESELLTRMPNGTFRFSGEEHVVLGGTSGADRMHSSEGDDTLWGDEGDDRLEGGAGNDALNGNDGHDIITDLFGDDNIKGGDGDDAINAGGGFDLILGGFGRDFVVAGADPKETFAGGGDDLVIAGDSSDVVFGNEGDDWIEGGDQADLLQGDNGDPFQEGRTGDDVIVGDGGNDDYDSEGGDDVMVSGPGIERNEGMFGFDWVTHRGDPQAANSDMNFRGLLPPDLDNIRDRFDNVEGLSGWDKADILRGDEGDATTMVEHELTRPGLVDGLGALLGGATSFTGGNIILGGAGGDLIEGRGGNDLIDGDAWLNVRLSVRHPDTGAEIRTADSMRALQADVFAGTIKPSQIRVVREIKVAPAGTDAVDTAVFSDVRANYDVIPNPDDSTEITVVHARGTQADGTDRLRNVERLTFSDQTVEVAPLQSNTPATGTVGISDTTPTEDQRLTATPAFADADGIDEATIAFNWQAETRPGVWATIAIGATLTMTDEEVGLPLRVVATFRDNDGVIESVTSAATQPVANIDDPATGEPTLNDTTPRQGQVVTALTGAIADQDGLVGVTFGFQWEQDAGDGFTPIAGATQSAFTPTAAQVGRPLRVVVSFTDNNGTASRLTSAASSPVSAASAPATVPATVPGGGGGGGGGAGAGAGAPAGGPSALSALVPGASALAPAGPGAAATDARVGSRAPAALAVRSLRVPALVTPAAAPITVAADVPAGARVVRIRVFRLTREAAGRRPAARRLVATVFRSTPKAKRYVFRLTERQLRGLKPGRYAVEVSGGRTRAQLGPASTRTVTVKKAGPPARR